MSTSKAKGNVGTIQALYDSFAEGDIDAVVAAWTSDIELNEPEGIIGGGTFHGAEEILENVFTKLATEWEDVTVSPERFVDGGDTVVAILTFSGTSTKTGKSTEYRGAHVFDFAGGKIARWTSFADTALFNAALEN